MIQGIYKIIVICAISMITWEKFKKIKAEIEIFTGRF